MPWADRLRNLKADVLPVQTGLARGYMQGLPGQEGYVGEYLFPVQGVDEEEGSIPIFGKNSYLVHDTERALGAESNVIPTEKIGTTPYRTVEHDLEYPVDYR